jgi:Domain of unknown function (DUF3471)
MKSPLVPVFKDKAITVSYGYGLQTIEFEGQQSVGHDGGIEGFVSSSRYYSNIDLSVIVLCNVETCDMGAISTTLRNIVFGKAVELPKKQVAIEIDSSILRRYLGSYELEPEFILSIRLNDNQLIGQASGQDEFELFASSETEFLTTFNAGATFIVEDGEVNELVWHQGGTDRSARKLSSSS